MARYSGRLRVEQARMIDAPLEAVYARVIDLRRWPEWNPWLEPEVAAQIDFTGPPDGAGGCIRWDSVRLGSGTVEHLRVQPGAQIEQQMRVRQPFQFSGRSVWRFAEIGGKTRLSWSLKGRVAFAMRAFAPTVNGTIRLDFRHGLDCLAGLVEPTDAPRYAITYLGVCEVAATCYASLRHEGPIEGLGEDVPRRMTELLRQLADRHVAAISDPIAVYASTDIRRRTTVCYIGVPIVAGDAAGVNVRELAAHRAYVVRLDGSRAGLEVAWYKAMQRMRVEGVQPDPSRPPFERCVGHRGQFGERGGVTELHLPVR